MKKILLAVVLMTGVFTGTFAAWQYGIVHSVWRKAHDAVTSVAGGGASGAAETESAQSQAPQTQQQTRGAMLSAMVAPALQSVIAGGEQKQTAAPQTTVVVPAPRNDARNGEQNDASPIDVASLAKSEPKLSAQQALQAQVVASSKIAAPQSAAQTPAQTPAQTAAVQIAPAPVLSDAKAQIRVIDQMLSSNPSEAMRRLNDLLATALQPDDAAEAGYRKGYAARMLRDEPTAESAWRETADQYPAHRGGRFSAMALGDTWFQRHTGDRSQLSCWDDISAMYSRALGKDDAPFLPEQVKTEIKRKLAVINDQIIFGSAPTKLARYHKVEPGELLGSIANKYRIDYESIARVNGINPNRISVGMDLKLIVGDVDVVVRKYAGDPARTPTVTWFIDGRWAREYPACVGDGMKTPAGTYTFTLKERDPSWTNPLNGQLLPNDHPENILGSRWMAMKGMNTQGLGIHGTTVDDSIPGYTSAGCVRLHNKDVEELFSFGRVGGRVTIIE